MSDDDDTWQLPEEQRPPAEVTAAVFAALRDTRRGTGNPSDLTNPLWAWLAAQPEINAYQVARHFGANRMGPPTWTNARFGQSCTALPDGRVVRIAGEHEDYYDPDFFIYNDVQITAPDGGITILGYAPEVFPPTDFHSATLIDDDLVVIGNLGYRPDRRHDATPVHRLDTRTFAFTPIVASGESPGWLHRHAALGDSERLLVTGGKREIELGGRTILVDNGDDYWLELGPRRIASGASGSWSAPTASAASCGTWPSSPTTAGTPPRIRGCRKGARARSPASASSRISSPGRSASRPRCRPRSCPRRRSTTIPVPGATTVASSTASRCATSTRSRCAW